MQGEAKSILANSKNQWQAGSQFGLLILYRHAPYKTECFMYD